MLQTSISLCQSLATLTMTLHRRPDLRRLARLAGTSGGGGGGEERKTIVEGTAEVVQKIFITCLTDRTSPRYSRPEGKKVGVYIFANMVLKLLFAVSRTASPVTQPHDHRERIRW